MNLCEKIHMKLFSQPNFRRLVFAQKTDSSGLQCTKYINMARSEISRALTVINSDESVYVSV